jgi:hypothetical protein
MGAPSGPVEPRPEGGREGRVRSSAARWWAAAGWVCGAVALFAVLLRISFSYATDSDGANSALQAWDMLHGNVLLHGWIIGDATYYTLELPLYAVTEIFLGLHTLTVHVGSAITYVLVVACAIALARKGSRGFAVAARCAIVLAVLAAPLLTPTGVSILLEKPDHTGTSAILLLVILLIDRAYGWRSAAPVVGLILCLGQIGDATVLYVAVPTVVLVCAGRALVTRKLRTPDGAFALAAALSVPLAIGLRALMLHLGGYLMIAPKQGLVAASKLSYNWHLTVHGIRILFGALPVRHAPLGHDGIFFGFVCLAAAGFGIARVLWTWLRASRAEHLLAVAIVINIAAYLFSSLPVPTNSREMVAVVPCGAVLAARALVPERIGALHARAAAVAAALVALFPLTVAASQPAATVEQAPLSAWLEAHGLTYGIAGYWDSSAVTVQSGDRVLVRAVHVRSFGLAAYDWETVASWYNPRLHDATFVIADSVRVPTNTYISLRQFERFLGKPAAMYVVASRYVLIYRGNVLRHVQQAGKALRGVQG